MLDKDKQSDRLEPKDIERKVHDLAKSMEKIRTRQADQDDVVVDLRQARLSRLEILAENLQPVFDDTPQDHEQFEFAMVKGEPPRLWIDMTSFVRMGRDGREFEFVKDTRMGRTILGRTGDVGQMGEHVSDYIAERILERERAIEGEWHSLKAETAVDEKENSTVTKAPAEQAPSSSNYGILRLLLWFVIGLIVGGGALLAAVWFSEFGSIVELVSGVEI